MNLDALGLSGLRISDFTAWVGWLAVVMLTLNFALGILQPLRYDTTIRWPHRRLPASLFKLHKWIGYSAIAVVVAHPLFLLWHPKKPFSLSAIYIPFTAPAETLLAGIGTLAFYMLLVVTVSSYLRLSLGLKLWKQIHYVAYALLPTALAHGVLVNSSLDEAVQIDYIDAGKLIVETCAAVTVALIVWRLAYRRRSREMDAPRPATSGEGIVAAGTENLPWAGQLTLTEVLQETWNVKTFRFTAGAGNRVPFTFTAGQYLQVAGIRDYTISSAPEERNHIEVTIKQEAGGFFSQHMHNDLKVGDRVDIRSAFGRFTFAGIEADKIVLIAGGVGVTPFLSMIRHLAAVAWPGELSLLYLVRTPKEVIRGEELRTLADQHPNFKVHVIYSLESEGSEGSEAAPGRITVSTLRSLVPDVAKRRAYICGPDSMMKAVTEMLGECGVPQTSIFVESFGAALASPGRERERATTAAVGIER